MVPSSHTLNSTELETYGHVQGMKYSYTDMRTWTLVVLSLSPCMKGFFQKDEKNPLISSSGYFGQNLL